MKLRDGAARPEVSMNAMKPCATCSRLTAYRLPCRACAYREGGYALPPLTPKRKSQLDPRKEGTIIKLAQLHSPQ